MSTSKRESVYRWRLLTNPSNRVMMIYEATIQPLFVESFLIPVATRSTLHTLLTHSIIVITLQVSCYFPYLSGKLSLRMVNTLPSSYN